MPMALFLLAFQAAATPAPPAPMVALDFDLARLRPLPALPGTCDRSDPSAITVCARREGGAYPLAEMARIFDRSHHLTAEMRVAGNVSANVHLQSVAMDRGAVSNRIMIGLRLPF